MNTKIKRKSKELLQSAANYLGYTITKTTNSAVPRKVTQKNVRLPTPSEITVSEISSDDSRLLTLIESVKSKGGICFSSKECRGLTVSIVEESLDLLLFSLDRYFDDGYIFLIKKDGEHINKSDLVSIGFRDREFSIAFITKKNDHKQAVAVNFVVWRRISHYERNDIYESGYPLLAARRVKLDTLIKMANNEISLDEANDKISPYFDVDVVYTWVDDKDPNWQNERELYQNNKINPQDKSGSRANLDERFQNRDELKYSLRSIEYYAKFIRNIYIVTNGQIPHWLDASNPKIHIVTHQELYPDRDVLPTFNSSSIETVLHRIPGLSENFIYFNDDFLLGSITTRHDFFSKRGHPKYFYSQQNAFFEDINEESEEYIKADKRAISLMERSFGVYSGEIMQHVPYPCRISLLSKYENDYSSEYAACRRERFRSERDIRPIAFMQGNFGQITGDCIQGDISHQYLPLWRPNLNKRLKETLAKKVHKSICINDVGVTPDMKNSVDASVLSFLESYYPIKSEFEK